MTSDAIAPRANFDLKSEIAAYWDSRADTFDASPNHPINPGAEENAWQALLKRHLPDRPNPRVLELGCGTGIVTMQLVKAGARVTAIDLGERMLAHARAKARANNVTVEFLYGDAEDPFVAGGGYDAIVCRHLVWTLLDPDAAIRRWLDVLAPGGKVLVIDYHEEKSAWGPRLRRKLAAWLEGGKIERHASTSDPDSPYQRITRLLPFGVDGVPGDRLAAMFRDAGYGPVVVDHMRDVLRAQRANRTLPHRIRMIGSERYLVAATKPASI